MNQATILIADDDRSIRTVLEKALRRIGYAVRSTGEAATLWQWIDAGEGDLVLTDVVMPDGNGLDLLPRIKRVRPDLPIVIMSAQTTLLTAIRATERRNRVQEARSALEKAAAAYPQDSAETATLYEALALIEGIR